MRRVGDLKRGVPAWKLVAGAFLHFGIVAYFLVVPVACLLGARRIHSAEDLLRLALVYSGQFLLGLVLLGVLATLLTLLIAPALRRTPAEEAFAAWERSRRSLAAAGEAARRWLDPATNRQLALLVAEPWDHADPRFQALAHDLERAVTSAAAAAAAARHDRRAEINALAEQSLTHIGAGLYDLLAGRAQLAEDRARTMANYVSLRYGERDSAIGRS